MKKERIRLETLEIPDIPEDDIVEVITNVKELLQKRAVKKYESSILKSLRELLYVHGWKSIVLQGGLTLLVALAVWLCLPNGYKMNSVAFLSLGSSLLSVAVTVEVFRCDIYGMKELEMASPYSPQRMLMWKMLLRGGISFLGILIFAIIGILIRVFFGMKDTAFKRRYPQIPQDIYTAYELDGFHRKFNSIVVASIGII